MTDYQFHTLFTAAGGEPNQDAFVSSWATSSLWEDDPESDVPAARVEQLGQLWDAAHATVKDIRRHTGLTQAAFAQRFCIPKRTIENWEGAVNECPAYTRLMLAQLTGYYQRPED